MPISAAVPLIGAPLSTSPPFYEVHDKPRGKSQGIRSLFIPAGADVVIDTVGLHYNRERTYEFFVRC